MEDAPFAGDEAVEDDDRHLRARVGPARPELDELTVAVQRAGP